MEGDLAGRGLWAGRYRQVKKSRQRLNEGLTTQCYKKSVIET